MNVETRESEESWNHSGFETPPLRIITASADWPDAGPGWVLVRQPLDSMQQNLGAEGDCLLLESGDLAAISVDELRLAALPVVIAPGDTIMTERDSAVVDIADGFIFASDDADALALVFAHATAGAPALQVREFSDGTARTINALSAEASRIAAALARLAQAQRDVTGAAPPVDAALVRRILRLRRERDRYFPAEVFADPAWDMLLDLTAARLEGRTVPVSSLCIAAAVPTTTALRWIRSLTEAGLFERQVDPSDGRRTHINLSADAASAMMGYLRMFSGQFAVR